MTAFAVTETPRQYTHIVRLENVQKYFGAVQALRNINLSIGRNETVGLIGDNGAGKSTLIKTLTGVLKPTSGRIFIRDKEIDLANYSVGKAHDLAIETVYQDKSLGEKQPLWRNFFVGRQITNRWGFIDIRAEKRVADEILKKAIGFRGVGITVDSTVALLSGGERQGIAIGRAMARRSCFFRFLKRRRVALMGSRLPPRSRSSPATASRTVYSRNGRLRRTSQSVRLRV